MQMCAPAHSIYYSTKLSLSVFQLNKGLDVNLAVGHPVGFKFYIKNKYVLRLIQLNDDDDNNNNNKQTRHL